jgi:hypothetical protein
VELNPSILNLLAVATKGIDDDFIFHSKEKQRLHKFEKKLAQVQDLLAGL